MAAIRLVQLLRVRRLRTAAELAADLEVSQRTVYRDVSDLIGSGVPIEGEPGVGYRLMPGYELPPLSFTPDEIQALVLGARMVQSWGGEELASSAKSALTKIEAALPAPLRELIANTALFAPAGAWSREVGLGLDALRRAISERRKLRFSYVDFCATCNAIARERDTGVRLHCFAKAVHASHGRAFARMHHASRESAAFRVRRQ